MCSCSFDKRKSYFVTYHVDTHSTFNIKMDKCDLPTFIGNQSCKSIHYASYQIPVVVHPQFSISILHRFKQLITIDILKPLLRSMKFLLQNFQGFCVSYFHEILSKPFMLESKPNFILQRRLNFMPTRNFTPIKVGLALRNAK